MKYVLTTLFLFCYAATSPADEPTVLGSYADAIAMMDEYGAPGIIIFHSPSCEPCKQLANNLNNTPMAKNQNEMAIEHLKSLYVVYYVDVTEEPSVAKAYGIQNLPTYVMISRRVDNGQLIHVGTGYGATTASKFFSWITDIGNNIRLNNFRVRE